MYYNSSTNEYFVSTGVGAGAWNILQTSGGLPAPLQSIASLITTANQMLYTTASNTYAVTGISAQGRGFVSQPTQGDQQLAIGLVPGSTVQTQNNLLQSIANNSGVVAANRLFYTTSSTTVAATGITATGRNIIDSANGLEARTAIDLEYLPASQIVDLTGDVVVGEDSVQTLTNKTIDADVDNTVVLGAGTTFDGITFSTAGTALNGDILTIVGGVAEWTTPAAGGDVVGPAAATDNAVARYDTATGKLIQNSVVTIGDTGVINGVSDLNLTGALAGATSVTSSGTISGNSITDGSATLTSGILTATTVNTTNLTTTGTVNLNGGAVVPPGFDITLTDSPVNPTDAANKNYVDQVAAGGAPFTSAEYATASGTDDNINLMMAPATIDGIAPSNGDRILVKDGSILNNGVNSDDNGIYIYNGAFLMMTRAADFPAGAAPPFQAGQTIFVESGTTQVNTSWSLLTTVNNVGVDPVTWVQTSGSQNLQAGNGLSQVGNQFNVDGSGTIVVNGNVAVNSSAVANQILLSSGTVGVAASYSSLPLADSNAVSGILPVANGGTGASSFGAGEILIGNGAGSIVSSGKTLPVGDLVGTSDSQTLTNKILDGDRIVTATSVFANSAVTPNTLSFNTSSLSAARTVTVPDATDTMALLARTQTFTNKTLTNSNNNVTARALFSNSGSNTVSVFGSANPSAGQVLTAINSTSAQWQTPASAGSVARIITVAQSGGDFTNITDAITAANALTPTQADPVTILVAPGTYVEAASLVVPSDVTIRGQGTYQTARVSIVDPNQNVFILSPRASLYYMIAENATGANVAGFIYSAAPGNSPARVQHCIAENCDIGFWSNGTGGAFSSILVLRNCASSVTTLATAQYGYYADAGGTMDGAIATASGFFGGSLDIGYYSSGSGSLMIFAEATANFVLSGFQADAAGGVAEIRIFSGSLSFIENTAVLAGVRSIVRVFSVYIQDDTATLFPNQIHLETQSVVSPATLLQFSSLVFRTDLTSFAADSRVEGNGLSTTTGETQNLFIGELVVGLPGQGFETVLGEGDSHVNGAVYLKYTGATAATDGAFSSDVTSTLNVVPGSTTVFDSGVVGDCLYIGYDTAVSGAAPFSSIKWENSDTPVGISPAGGYDSATNTHYIAFEYFSTTAGNWRAFGTFAPGSSSESGLLMSSDANEPYIPHRFNVMDAPGVDGNQDGQYQYRFGFFRDTTGAEDWGTTILNGVTGYFMRFRVVTALATNPTVNFIKLGTNRKKINNTGFTEYFGKAQPRVRYPFDINWIIPANSSPSNQDMYLQTNSIAVGRNENSFVDGTTDRAGFLLELPEDIDTSKPINIRLRYRVSTAASGNINFNIYWGYNLDIQDDPSAVGTSLSSVWATNGSAPGTAPGELGTINDLITVSSSTDNRVLTVEYDLDISELRARRSTGSLTGDILWISYERQGAAGNDTYAGNMGIIQVTPQYVAWCEGGYIG